MHSSIGHIYSAFLNLLSNCLLHDCLLSDYLLSRVLTPSHFDAGLCCICRRAILFSTDHIKYKNIRALDEMRLVQLSNCAVGDRLRLNDKNNKNPYRQNNCIHKGVGVVW